MEIKIKVPKWVNTDEEGICMLFAFLRKVVIQYPGTPLDMFGYDMRRIMDVEINDLHEFLYDYVDPKFCKIAKLNREHFVFYMKQVRTRTRVLTLKETSSHIRWAYLMGCTNYNLLEEDTLALDKSRRPSYTPMYRFDRDVFAFSGRGT